MAGIYIIDVAEMSVVRVNIHGSELKIAEFSCPPAGSLMTVDTCFERCYGESKVFLDS
jgi:hypothetical protein